MTRDIYKQIVVVLIILSWGCVTVSARSLQTGHFILALTDKNAQPITNATVHVETLNTTGLGAGTYRSHYSTFSARTDMVGVADVAFDFLTSHFDWWIETPSHYSGGIGYQTSHLKPTVVQSDYCDLETNTVAGLAKYNELKALYEGGDFRAYAQKFEPRDISFASNTICKVLSLYPKRNPQAMFAYGEDNWMKIPTTGSTCETNGHVLTSFPRIEIDLEKCALLPPYNSEREEGLIVDFSIERYSFVTNGIENFYGRMVFQAGCGAYKCSKTNDESFPSTYNADVNAVYESEFPFHVVRNQASGSVISYQGLLNRNEYMVLRTRRNLGDGNSTNGWHYSKILGPIRIGNRFSWCQSVFNPRFNDQNLELDVNDNLAGPRGESRYP